MDNNKKIPLNNIPTLTRNVVESSISADSFSIPVNIHLKGDINGVATIRNIDNVFTYDSWIEVHEEFLKKGNT